MTLRKKAFRTGRLLAPHWARKAVAGTFKRKRVQETLRQKTVAQSDIEADLRAIGVRRGKVLLAQTALSRIGFVEGGPSAYLDALQAAVGSSGTLLIPTFTEPPKSFSEPFVFDALKTPSNTGAVAETFRKRPGVVRSLHPTHSFAAWGKNAGQWMSGHERSPTGFDEGTPYDRLAKKGGRILLVANNNNSLVHYLELLVGFPLTHQPGTRLAGVVDEHGVRQEVKLKLHTLGERLVIVEDSKPQKRDYALFQDYLLVPYPERRHEVQALGLMWSDSAFLAARQEELTRKGVLKFGKIGAAPCVLIDAKPFSQRMARDLSANLHRFQSEYAQMVEVSGNWNEIQWYCLVWKNRLALRSLKVARRLLGTT